MEFKPTVEPAILGIRSKCLSGPPNLFICFCSVEYTYHVGVFFICFCSVLEHDKKCASKHVSLISLLPAKSLVAQLALTGLIF